MIHLLLTCLLMKERNEYDLVMFFHIYVNSISKGTSGGGIRISNLIFCPFYLFDAGR
uniref:Vesicle transport protein GOT1B-like n=1 Tax=Rhizophora mucronata TaxID=61149 RepID=A0A2P2KIM8_RHIMU